STCASYTRRSSRVSQVMQVFRMVAGALDYAHQQGMIHRDVKSANILLDQHGSAYLTDFGIAHIVSSTHLTSTGSLIGTPIYMSPEQCQGKKATTASDIYSLGMVLYEMLTGKVPFAEDTPLAVIHKHIYEPVPSPREYRPDLPQEIEQVVMKALAREPEDRYASAHEFLQALAAAVQGDFEPRTVAISGPPPTQPAPEVDVPEPEPAPEEEPDPQQTVADLSPQETMEPPDFDQHLPLAVPEREEVLSVPPTVLGGEQDATVVDESPISPPTVPPDMVQETSPDQSRQAVTMVSEDLPLPSKEETQPQPPAPPKKKSAGWTLAVIVAAAAVILLIVAWATGVFSGYNPNNPELCNSPDDCLQTAWHFKEQGDIEGARASLERMERLIPPERMPEKAFMFCEGGEIYWSFGKPDPARDYFQRCLELAPDADLRNHAREMLSRID
ncbi:MAG: protein kinase domain-containing protein, partial [Anaerolineales bacterium]